MRLHSDACDRGSRSGPSSGTRRPWCWQNQVLVSLCTGLRIDIRTVHQDVSREVGADPAWASTLTLTGHTDEGGGPINAHLNPRWVGHSPPTWPSLLARITYVSNGESTACMAEFAPMAERTQCAVSSRRFR